MYSAVVEEEVLMYSLQIESQQQDPYDILYQVCIQSEGDEFQVGALDV